MGNCISRNKSLQKFFDTYVMTYPGTRLHLSQLLVQYVWKSECYRIFEYINEEDPLKLKNTNYNIKKTLDCIGRYRKRTKRPFMYPDEKTRYDIFIKERSTGSINSFPIQKTYMNKTEVEYLEDCKLI
jgi:hypothetical protein